MRITRFDAYVPDPYFRKRDVRFEKAGRHRLSVDKRHERYKSKKCWFTVGDLHFDNQTGKLMYPAGEALYRNGKNFQTKNGYIATSYRAPKREHVQVVV